MKVSTEPQDAREGRVRSSGWSPPAGPSAALHLPIAVPEALWIATAPQLTIFPIRTRKPREGSQDKATVGALQGWAVPQDSLPRGSKYKLHFPMWLPQWVAW